MNKTTQRYGTVLRIYDKPDTLDRYTILPPRWASEYRHRPDHNGCHWDAIGASEQPYGPQGFSMWVIAASGKHLGRRIHWDDLPADVRDFARHSFPEYAPKETTP